MIPIQQNNSSTTLHFSLHRPMCVRIIHTHTRHEKKSFNFFFFFFLCLEKEKEKEKKVLIIIIESRNSNESSHFFSSFFSHHIFSLSIIPLKPHVSISLFLSLKRNDFLVCIVLLSLEIVIPSWKKLWLLGFSLCLIIQLYKM